MHTRICAARNVGLIKLAAKVGRGARPFAETA